MPLRVIYVSPTDVFCHFTRFILLFPLVWHLLPTAKQRPKNRKVHLSRPSIESAPLLFFFCYNKFETISTTINSRFSTGTMQSPPVVAFATFLVCQSVILAFEFDAGHRPSAQSANFAPENTLSQAVDVERRKIGPITGMDAYGGSEDEEDNAGFEQPSRSGGGFSATRRLIQPPPLKRSLRTVHPAARRWAFYARSQRAVPLSPVLF